MSFASVLQMCLKLACPGHALRRERFEDPIDASSTYSSWHLWRTSSHPEMLPLAMAWQTPDFPKRNEPNGAKKEPKGFSTSRQNQKIAKSSNKFKKKKKKQCRIVPQKKRPRRTNGQNFNPFPASREANSKATRASALGTRSWPSRN